MANEANATMDSVEALKNDYYEAITTFNPNIITITRVKPEDGDMCCLKVHVKAPCYILKNQSSNTPVRVNENTFFVKVKSGYPVSKPVVYYSDDAMNASVNTFRSGTQCTDQWNPSSSSIRTAIEKTIRDIIHDPTVTRYDSMANGNLKEWQQNLERQHIIPTIDPAIILKRDEVRHSLPNCNGRTSNRSIPAVSRTIPAASRSLPGRG